MVTEECRGCQRICYRFITGVHLWGIIDAVPCGHVDFGSDDSIETPAELGQSLGELLFFPGDGLEFFVILAAVGLELAHVLTGHEDDVRREAVAERVELTLLFRQFSSRKCCHASERSRGYPVVCEYLTRKYRLF